MLDTVKNVLYFPFAWYFRFFAEIRLRRWKPRVIVVTGSSGKTTLLHLLESQLANHAKFSHHANSSYGIPFDILDLHRRTLKSSEWLRLFVQAPIQAFGEPYEQNCYVVEADTDRPGEGRFLAEMLRPEVVLWVSVSATHGMNFDGLVADGKFATVEEAIAHDFGYFLANCKKLVLIDGDSELEVAQIKRTKAKVKAVTEKRYLDKYDVQRYGTQFVIEKEKYLFQALLPKEVFYSLVMCKEAVEYLDLPFDRSFSEFVMPEGRGTILNGINDTILIDSTYNANLSSMEAMLKMFAKFPSEKKWVVLGDMLELGEKEQEEHERLAEVLAKMELERIILVGKRVGKYTFDALQGKNPAVPTVVKFENQKDALTYVEENIQGEEALLFKGSQSIFLEGILEALLKNKEDVSKLPRRGIFWRNKRKEIYG